MLANPNQLFAFAGRLGLTVRDEDTPMGVLGRVMDLAVNIVDTPALS